MRSAIVICDMWSTHWCKSIQARTALLAPKINDFINKVRSVTTLIAHYPSNTVDTFYDKYPQRIRMRYYPKSRTISEVPRCFAPPLFTFHTNGCPDFPKCLYHDVQERQHELIEIHSKDVISDTGQEFSNFSHAEKVNSVFLTGTALNMCLLGRAFGILGMKEIGIAVTIISDLVEIAYSPSESPYMNHEDALAMTLRCVSDYYCPVMSSEEVLTILGAKV